MSDKNNNKIVIIFSVLFAAPCFYMGYKLSLDPVLTGILFAVIGGAIGIGLNKFVTAIMSELFSKEGLAVFFSIITCTALVIGMTFCAYLVKDYETNPYAESTQKDNACELCNDR